MTRALRTGLALLAAVQVVLGLWTMLAPASFYDAVPTADVTPFSEHPFRDFGGATLGPAVVLGAAAVWPETRLVVVALAAYEAFAVPHLAFHLAHPGDGAADAAMVVALAGSVLLPLALLAVALRRHGASAGPDVRRRPRRGTPDLHGSASPARRVPPRP